MKIIFVNRYFYPDHSATSQLLTELAFDLAKLGFNIHVLTSRLIYDDNSEKLSAHEMINSIHILRIWTSRFGRKNLIGRSIDYLTFYVSCAINLFRISSRNDLIIAKTDPPLISEVVSIIARLKRAKMINWLQDLFPEAALALKIKGVNPLLNRMLQIIRNSSLRFASLNVTIGINMFRKLIQIGIKPDSIEVVHNWSDGDLITPKLPQNNQLRQKWNLNGKIVVGYSGNMGRDHDFHTILDVAHYFKHSNEVVFLFIGGGLQCDWIKSEVVRRGLNNFIFKPYQPRSRLGESLTVPDIHLISFKPELEGLAVPSKFYGVAAAGRPIIFIGDPNGEIGRVIKEEACGFVAKIGDKQAVENYLVQLVESKEWRGKMGINARLAFENRFSKSIAVKKWQDIITKVSEK